MFGNAKLVCLDYFFRPKVYEIIAIPPHLALIP
jgi:hypothetical protein